MEGNGKVFISHSHQDNARCAPLQQIYAGDQFRQSIEREIEARDIFVRVCSPAATLSYWVGLETDAFHCLLADEHARGLRGKRRLIHVIMHPDYEVEPFVRATLHVDAVHAPDAEWREQLRRALTQTQHIPAPSAASAALPFSQPSQGNVRVFIDDDDGYRAWVESHPTGFVLNSYRTLNPDYVMQHRTTCGWIRRPIERGDRLTDVYIKICSADRAALEAWSQRQAGTDAHPCGLCKPR